MNKKAKKTKKTKISPVPYEHDQITAQGHPSNFIGGGICGDLYSIPLESIRIRINFPCAQQGCAEISLFDLRQILAELNENYDRIAHRSITPRPAVRLK